MSMFQWLTVWLLMVVQGGAKSFDNYLIFEYQPV